MKQLQLISACGLVCLAAVLIQAQYNTFDSDSNSGECAYVIGSNEFHHDN